MKKGKKQIDALKKFDQKKSYTIDEAFSLIPELSTSKFDGSVEAHIRLKMTQAEAKQPIKGTVSLPHSFGKEKRVIVLCDGEDVAKAQNANADNAGLEDLIKKIQGGWLDFDIVLATPKVMPKIAILGKTLGTKGLMPNPKNGTITTEVEKTVKEFKSGKVAFKSDKQGIVHSSIGKVSTKKEDIRDNFLTLIKKVIEASKKSPVTALETVTIAPSMGPGVKVDVNDLISNI
jgi:large subunit ribosomal protein L1